MAWTDEQVEAAARAYIGSFGYVTRKGLEDCPPDATELAATRAALATLPLSPPDALEAIRGLSEAATGGKWEQHAHHVVVWGEDGANVASCGDPQGTTQAGYYVDPGFGDGLKAAYANAAFIVACVSYVRDLLARSKEG